MPQCFLPFLEDRDCKPCLACFKHGVHIKEMFNLFADSEIPRAINLKMILSQDYFSWIMSAAEALFCHHNRPMKRFMNNSKSQDQDENCMFLCITHYFVCFALTLSSKCSWAKGCVLCHLTSFFLCQKSSFVINHSLCLMLIFFVFVTEKQVSFHAWKNFKFSSSEFNPKHFGQIHCNWIFETPY